jgi:hypothetical protein
MKMFAKAQFTVQFLLCLAFAQTSQALSMKELRQMPNLTPVTFAKCFADFKFKFHAEVQNHDVFLGAKSGDCDDYATVAAEILAERGYTPRMIAIRMKGETHVVCYIQETGSYLDYNTRKDADPLVPCSPIITDIARKVAKSFGRDWVATYEFTYDESESVKRLIANIVSNPSSQQVASSGDPQAGATPKSKKSKSE